MDFIVVISIVLLIILLVTGAPFYIAFAACAIPFLLFYAEVPGNALGAMAAESVSSFTLMAIPLFILLGSIMSRIGATKDLFDFARTIFGHMRGGLGITAIVACAGFGAMCGSGLATALAISTIAVPELKRAGYKRSTIAAICGSSGGLGLLIPPSLSFIILGAVLQVSVGDLFIAGIIPGLITTLMLSIACYITTRKNKDIILEEKSTWKARFRALIKATPAFAIPVAILVSIYFGVATPTESAAVACVVSLLLGLFFYRTVTFEMMQSVLRDTARSTAAVWFVVMGAMIFGRVLAFENIPQAGAEFIGGMGLSYGWFIAATSILFFILGMFFDAFIMTLACLPPLLGALTLYDVPLVWFGVIFTMLVIIGQVTPPVGITLYASATGAQADIGETIKEVIPYLIALVVSLAIILLFPVLIVF